jgi:hypothetical protein
MSRFSKAALEGCMVSALLSIPCRLFRTRTTTRLRKMFKARWPWTRNKGRRRHCDFQGRQVSLRAV